MRIEYLLLENFALVKSGMGLDKIELDFSKCKNMITLIIGNNGTGKTGGILANIHPYAGLGHLEARNDSDIIIPGKSGRKLAVFKSGKHVYVIEHHYTWQGANKSRKISSYCRKDGNELNPSGLVSKFNEIIEQEFQIDINFLKLMRLGPNVKNFISLSATERKGFISKLLESVEIYLHDQKVIAEKSSLLRNALKIAVDKSNQLDIKDISIMEDTIREKQKLLDHYKEEKENCIKRFFEYKGSINVDAINAYTSNLFKWEQDYRDIKNELTLLKKPKYLHIKIDGESLLKSYNDQLKGYQEKKNSIVYRKAELNSKISKAEEDKELLEKQLDETSTDKELTELSNYIEELKESVSDYEKTHRGNKPSLTKEELTSDVDKLNMILFHLDQILQLPIYVLDYFRNIQPKFGSDINKMDNWATDRERKVSVLLQQSMHNSEKEITTVLFTPDGCTHWKECPYYDYWKDDDKKKKDTKKADYEQELDCLQGIHMIASAIYSIRRILSMRKEIHEYIITEKNVMQCILLGDKNYFMDPKFMQNLLETIEEYEQYQADLNRLHEMETEYQLKQAKRGNISIKELTGKLNSTIISLHDMNEEMRVIDSELSAINKKISNEEEMIYDFGVYSDYERKMVEYTHRIEELKKTRIDLDKISELRSQFDTMSNRYKEETQRLNNIIMITENEIYELKRKINTFIELSKEIKKIEENFNYNELIRDAVSSKGGIPKIHVVHYCKALKSIANSIISEIYGGELILRDFEITDTKFNIPYYTKGANVDDIIHASQAETSIVTLAISFAILIQFMPKYSIVLLDEIDGPLSPQYKTKMLATLEGQLKALGSEQCFLITQSDQYLDYPVNLIITDKEHKNVIRPNHKVIFSR